MAAQIANTYLHTNSVVVLEESPVLKDHREPIYKSSSLFLSLKSLITTLSTAREKLKVKEDKQSMSIKNIQEPEKATELDMI